MCSSLFGIVSIQKNAGMKAYFEDESVFSKLCGDEGQTYF